MFNIVFISISLFAFALISQKNGCVKKPNISSEIAPYAGVISIIIPARNEEKRIGILLKSINENNDNKLEIIVANDMSTDNTEEISKKHQAQVINIESKAQDIKGKTNACDIGFKNSKGEIIIFLDADTIVEPKFIHKIRELFSDIDQEVVTIQPKHRSKKFFEQLSLFFHISSIVSTGVVSTIPFGFGLYGPCIAMRRQIYETTNGFINTKVKNSIIEDVALSIVMKTQKVSITRYLGDGLISYRMFENFSTLFLGWKRNISSGFRHAPFLPSLIIVLFYGSIISIPIEIYKETDKVKLYILLGLFFISLLLLIRVANQIGNYFLVAIAYPLSLSFFIIVFSISVISKIFRLQTTWAGRKMNMDDQ